MPCEEIPLDLVQAWSVWAQKIRNKHPKNKSRSAFNFEFVSPSFFRLEATYHLHFAVIVCHLVVRCNVAKLHQANWQYFVAVAQHVAIEVTSKKCIKTLTLGRDLLFDQQATAQNMPESHIGVECPQNEHLRRFFGVCAKTQFFSNVAPVMAEHEESLPDALVVSYVSSWERDLERLHSRGNPASSAMSNLLDQ